MFFQNVVQAPPDPIFGLQESFYADNRPNKINLIIGIYKDEHLRAHLMTSVQKAKRYALDQDLLADYLPLCGLPEFVEQIGPLVFGQKNWTQYQSRIFTMQALGGTGALQVGAQFLSYADYKTVAISHPTWPNHRSIFERAGQRIETYPYYNREKHGIDVDTLCSFFEKLPEHTVIVLHPVCHNPTGCDPSLEEWRAISRVLLKQKLLPFFDFAYQGFGSGIKEDRSVIELFLQEGHEMLIAYSCSKNFSLYCQRVGALFIVGQNADTKLRIASQIKKIIRSLYSNPPSHGASIVATLLQDPLLKDEWEKEIESMRHRIEVARKSLVQGLCTKMDFSFLYKHKGMFSFMDLDASQVQKLINKFGIYLLDNGRISLTGLNKNNINQVIDSILTVCSYR